MKAAASPARPAHRPAALRRSDLPAINDRLRRSAVDGRRRGAKHVNVNLLRYFSEPATLDSEAQAFLQRGMALAMEWATQGLVVPHVSQTIDGTVEAINAGLQSLKAGHGTLGKVAVIVDRDLAFTSEQE